MSALQSAPRATAACVHCSKSNLVGAAYCESCGKALPLPGAGAQPRFVGAKEYASTQVGKSVQTEALQKHLGAAWKALFAVAALQTLGTVIVAAIMFNQQHPDAMLFTVFMGAVAAIFAGLSFWARKNPLPAAISGLVIYLTLLALDAAFDPSSIVRGIILKIIIISVLAKAISAGMKHRELARQMSEQDAW